MDEKILIEGKTSGNKFLILLLSLVGVILMPIATEVDYSASHEVAVALYILGGLLIVVGFFWFLSVLGCRIVVTDKRIYGKARWGKRVDLPIDSVSAIAAGKMNSISVSTASGGIAFISVKNRDEIHRAISEIIINRQTKPNTFSNNQGASSDYTEELKKIKELLDAGVITQEEFDAKKKQILGL